MLTKKKDKKGLRIFIILVLIIICGYFLLYTEGITGMAVGAAEEAEVEEDVFEALE